MRGISSGILTVTAIILIVEILGYLGIIQLVGTKIRKIKVSLLYWLLTSLVLSCWLMAFFDPDKIRRTTDYSFFYFVIFISTLNFFPKFLFSVFVIFAAPFRFFKRNRQSQVVLLSGLILSLGMILIMGYGLIAGKRTIRTEEVKLTLSSLPAGLNGLKIVQISDLHLGSFESDRFLSSAVERINRIEPDLILFTGDIVNNYHQEMDGFDDQLKQLKAGLGKYAILGNHDYGDYTDWSSPVVKEQNFSLIMKKIRKSGFKLLLNQSEQILVHGTQLYLIGVENWGHGSFPRYARLDSALAHVPDSSFRILMTHDPAHWDQQVVSQTSIPLTLSGHTHGGQFALKLAGIEFSPIRFVGKRWGGLYQEGEQFLYVNRGFGCVGLPARIDMDPEISVFTLFRK
ncbi:MAG: metallophosphoesterase [Prolixibacteraceae bacterium]